MRSIGDAIRNGMISMDMANNEQEQLAKEIGEFASNTRPRILNIKKEKKSVQNGH